MAGATRAAVAPDKTSLRRIPRVISILC
jgi:hypothetical protein